MSAIVQSVAPTGLVQKGVPTNGGAIEITGTGDAVGDTITLYNGNTVVGSGLAGVNGAFDIVTSATFFDGTYSNHRDRYERRQHRDEWAVECGVGHRAVGGADRLGTAGYTHE